MFRSAIFLLFLSTILLGCAAAGGYPENPVDPATEIGPLTNYFDAKKMLLYQSMAPNDPQRMALRNEIIYGRVAAYDVEFTQFQIRLNRERIIPDAAADSAIAVMGGVGTAVAATATKTALLAATTATTGIKGAVDKDVFYSQTMTALFAQMSANRAAVLATIDKGTALPDSSYPLTRGLIDTAAYRDAGSIPGALAGISHDAGKKTDEAKLMISQIQDAKIALATARYRAK